MKQIITLGGGKFVTIDSYGVSHETRRWNIIIGVLAVTISAITFGAMFGIDVTSLSAPLTPYDTHRTHR